MNGILILNKPKGLSSNSACRKVGHILNERKVGHLGTLDPMAEGVLPVTLGKCTKLFDYYLKKNKEYIAEFTFGFETDTLDSEGQILYSGGEIPQKTLLDDVVKSFVGKQSQLPPKYSAKKIDGKRAYDLARSEQDFELSPKEIEIFQLECLEQISMDTFKFKIACSSGTYIRSIARDLAHKIGSYATMTKLIRTKCGEFDLINSHTFEDLKETDVINVEDLMNDKKQIILQSEQFDTFINTGRVPIGIFDDEKDVCLKYQDKIISFGIIENGYFISKIRFM